MPTYKYAAGELASTDANEIRRRALNAGLKGVVVTRRWPSDMPYEVAFEQESVRLTRREVREAINASQDAILTAEPSELEVLVGKELELVIRDSRKEGAAGDVLLLTVQSTVEIVGLSMKEPSVGPDGSVTVKVTGLVPGSANLYARYSTDPVDRARPLLVPVRVRYR